jgi:hypothetical protein
MRKIALLIAALGLAVTPLLFAAPAHAQATRTWVSGVGDDANPCSRTAPCKTFAGAISKTAVGGEINCIDPGGFGAVTITKSLTIDCHEVYASILVSGTNAINIPFDSFTDAFKTVRLRNINFNGLGGVAGSGLSGISITGASNTAGSRVVIEDCMIDGFTGSPGRGINDTRVNGGKLEINNTTIRDVAGSGVVILPASGSVRIDASLFNVRIYNASNGGLAVNSGAKATITNSVVSGNGTGLDSEGAGSEIHVNEVQVSSNGTGIFTGTGGVVHLNSSDVSFNTACTNGTVNTYGNNRFQGNGGSCTTTPNSPGFQ